MLLVLTNMSRPQIGIDRLPPRHTVSEPRELMNCKSCRKRKIKCNRLKPSCEACQVFAVQCIYDAVPKKRGPKTDVLASLIQQIDGKDKILKQKCKKGIESPSKNRATSFAKDKIQSDLRVTSLSDFSSNQTPNSGLPSVIVPSSQGKVEPNTKNILMEAYFSRLHGKPFRVLDETSIHQRLESGQLPQYLLNAIYSLAIRFSNTASEARKASTIAQYIQKSRAEITVDEPSLDALQALVLLSQASFLCGKGRWSYMYLSFAINMVFALNLQREQPPNCSITPMAREHRRQLFWTCYMLDKLTACGSKRPSLISDDSILLKLPSFQEPSGLLSESSLFQRGSSLQYTSVSSQHHGGPAIIIDIIKILGSANRYLAAGGPKADSHFPWHAESTLSRIRQDLDMWMAEYQYTFSSMEMAFSSPDSYIIMLSKIIYHLIHSLIYRPFIPLDVFELTTASQQQAWRIEATNVCFYHANAIADHVQLWKTSGSVDFPAFLAYCLSTAATIHLHGVFYNEGEGVFAPSKRNWELETRELVELRRTWDGAQYQLDFLRSVQQRHAELTKAALSSSISRGAPVFNFEDFLERYQGRIKDGAFLVLENGKTETTIRIPSSCGAGSQQELSFSTHNVSSPMLSAHAEPTTSPKSLKRKAMLTEDETKSPELNSAIGRKRIWSISLEGRHGHMSSNGESSSGYAFAPSISFQDPVAKVQNYDPMLSIPNHLEGTSPRVAVRSLQQSQFSSNLSDPQSGGITSPHGVASTISESEVENDPFLNLLEQLAENDQSRGGPSELDLFLGNG